MLMTQIYISRPELSELYLDVQLLSQINTSKSEFCKSAPLSSRPTHFRKWKPSVLLFRPQIWESSLMPSSISNLPRNPVGSFLKIYPGSNHSSLSPWPLYWSLLFLAWTTLNKPVSPPFHDRSTYSQHRGDSKQNFKGDHVFLCSKPSQIFPSQS